MKFNKLSYLSLAGVPAVLGLTLLPVSAMANNANPNGWRIVKTSPSASYSYLLHGTNSRQYLNANCTNQLLAENINREQSSYSVINGRTGAWVASCDAIIAAYNEVNDTPTTNTSPNGWQIVKTSPSASYSYLLHGTNSRQYLNANCTNQLLAANINREQSSYSAINGRTGAWVASCGEIIAAYSEVDDNPNPNPNPNPNGWRIVKTSSNANYSYLLHGTNSRQYLNANCTNQLLAENINREQSSYSVINGRIGEWGASCDEIVSAFSDDTNSTPIPPPSIGGDSLTRNLFESKYMGSFRLPASIPGFKKSNGDEIGGLKEEYGGLGLAIDVQSKQLYMPAQRRITARAANGSLVQETGNSVITRVKIPSDSDILSGRTIDGIVTVDAIDGVDIYGMLEQDAKGTGNTPRYSFDSHGLISDLKIVDGKIIGLYNLRFDSGGQGIYSHFTIDELNLSQVNNADVNGLYNVTQGLVASQMSNVDGVSDAGFVSGYMTEIPLAHRSKFKGRTHITGMAGASIVSRTNLGPGAYLYNANANNIKNNTTNMLPLLHYPLDEPLRWRIAELGLFGETNNKIPQDTALWNQVSHIRGVFFVPNTNSIAFIGRSAANGKDVNSGAIGSASTFYGAWDQFGEPYNDPYDTDNKGYHAFGGSNEYQIWVYDIDVLAALVAEGNSFTNVQPQTDFRFDFGLNVGDTDPRLNGQKRIGGTAVDPTTNRLYVLETLFAQFDGRKGHVVHVYQF